MVLNWWALPGSVKKYHWSLDPAGRRGDLRVDFPGFQGRGDLLSIMFIPINQLINFYYYFFSTEDDVDLELLHPFWSQ